MKITVTFEKEISHEDIEDHLICALEGGSNYWYWLPDLTMVKKHYEKGDSTPSSVKLIRSVLDHNEVIPVHDLEEPEEKLGDLSMENIQRGFDLYVKDGKDIDPGNCDAGDADVLFQYIVMGEIVFG